MTQRKHIGKRKFNKSEHSFFDDIATILISITNYTIVGDLIHHNGTAHITSFPEDKRYDKEGVFIGLSINEIVGFVFYPALKNLVNNSILDTIEINIYENNNPQIRDDKNLKYFDFKFDYQRKVLASGYVNYYESIKDKIETSFGNDPAKWPDILNFARVLRNAYAHGGKINIKNSNAKPVEWKGIKYSFQNNGQKIDQDIFVVEVINLMIDIDKLIMPNS